MSVEAYKFELKERFDTEELARERAGQRLETARTRIGRFFARRELGRHQTELAQITDEFDALEVYDRFYLQKRDSFDH